MKGRELGLKLLLIHADLFEYEVRSKALDAAEELNDLNRKGKAENALVAFITVESPDENALENVVSEAATSIADVARKVGATKIVVYPYAHLSPDLSTPTTGIRALKMVEDSLKEMGFEVLRSPFGWYKSFTVKCKGHPLSELSRTITAVEKPKEVKVSRPEEMPKSVYVILTPGGEEYVLNEENYLNLQVLNQDLPLKKLVENELGGKEAGVTPPHIKLMKRLELVDYEPASDVGHFRFYPKGAVIKDCLQEYATKIAVEDLNAMKIETPFLYRLDQPDIAEQASRFRERDYRFKIEGKELTLRFAGDFGLFRMMKDVIVSYRQLPLRIYELSHSFRLEQSGECVGLKRLRAFTMPDIHCFCKDLNQAMEEYKELFKYYTKLTNSMGVDYAVAFRTVKEFYEANKSWFIELLKIVNKPALIELLPEMKHYWVVKHEYQVIDSVGGNMQLVTVQLDVEDAARYGIFYIDENGEKRGCTILHSSMGSIERWIAAILEQAAKNIEQAKQPKLPLWLSPTQVRIVPVSESYLDLAIKLAEKLKQERIRVDVDDRDLSVAKKIRDAETEWVPYVIVVGEKEARGDILTVRVRGMGIRKLSLTDLIDELKAQLVDKPKIPLYLPMKLSMKPKFAG